MKAANDNCSKKTPQTTQNIRNVLTVKLILLGLNSLGVEDFSLTCAAGGGGEGGGGKLGVQSRPATSGHLWPSELKALSSSLRLKGPSEEWLSSRGSGNLTETHKLISN